MTLLLLLFVFFALAPLSTGVTSEKCLNESAAIRESNPSLVSDANNLDKVFDDCNDDSQCFYTPTPDNTFETECTNAGGAYYEYSWTVTCETSDRNETLYQFTNVKDCVSANCTISEADDEITFLIQAFENQVESGSATVDADSVTCKSDFMPTVSGAMVGVGGGTACLGVFIAVLIPFLFI